MVLSLSAGKDYNTNNTRSEGVSQRIGANTRVASGEDKVFNRAVTCVKG